MLFNHRDCYVTFKSLIFWRGASDVILLRDVIGAELKFLFGLVVFNGLRTLAERTACLKGDPK